MSLVEGVPGVGVGIDGARGWPANFDEQIAFGTKLAFDKAINDRILINLDNERKLRHCFHAELNVSAAP